MLEFLRPLGSDVTDCVDERVVELYSLEAICADAICLSLVGDINIAMSF